MNFNPPWKEGSPLRPDVQNVQNPLILSTVTSRNRDRAAGHRPSGSFIAKLSFNQALGNNDFPVMFSFGFLFHYKEDYKKKAE